VLNFLNFKYKSLVFSDFTSAGNWAMHKYPANVRKYDLTVMSSDSASFNAQLLHIVDG
jgi:hypothetical protein